MTKFSGRNALKTLTLLLLIGAHAAPSQAAAVARFDWITYQGSDPAPAPHPGQYRNPVLGGFYPDPSVTKIGRDFYLVNSTFSFYPGIPVWKSRDLVHWRQLGNAIDRPGQLDFTGLGMSRGVFAPAIAHHDGRFFIANTCVDCGGNFIITARDPKGPWSQPVWLRDVGGIDPSIFVDDDGSMWLVNNDMPRGPERYEGHRAIWLHRIDPASLQTVGKPRPIVDAGVDPSAKPVWVEGPHLYRKDGYYYLMAAEGGTGDQHSEVIFRADRIEGPYVPGPRTVNPILTQRDLDPARKAPITSSGHADLIKLDNGDWWAVFLATRPYEGDLYNTGRETFLLPVSWHDGWPTILPQGKAIPHIATAPRLPRDTAAPTSGTFTARDDFSAPKLGLEWMMLRNPTDRWWRLDKGALALDVRPERIGDGKQPSFLGHRQQNMDATVTTALNFVPADGEEAGLAAIQNDDFFLSFALTRVGGRTLLRVARRAGATEPANGVTVATRPAPAGPIQLRIHARGGRYDFDYAARPGQWHAVARDVDATILSSAKAHGFVGTLIGPYAQTSKGAAPAAVKQ